jgi:hypothetical protein
MLAGLSHLLKPWSSAAPSLSVWRLPNALSIRRPQDMAPGALSSGAVMAAPPPNGFGAASGGGGNVGNSSSPRTVAAVAAAAQQHLANPRIEAQLAQLSCILSATTPAVPMAAAPRMEPKHLPQSPPLPPPSPSKQQQQQQQSMAMQEVLLRHMQQAASSGMEPWQPSQATGMLMRPLALTNSAMKVPLQRQPEPLMPAAHVPAAQPAQRFVPRAHEHRSSRVCSAASVPHRCAPTQFVTAWNVGDARAPCSCTMYMP